MSPPACPILRELESAVFNLQSRTATRGEGWAWCVRGCRAHHATSIILSIFNNFVRFSLKYFCLAIKYFFDFNSLQNVAMFQSVKNNFRRIFLKYFCENMSSEIFFDFLF